MRTKTTLIVATAASLLLQCVAFAQTTATPKTTSAETTAVTNQQTSTSGQPITIDSRELRQEFMDRLRQYPPEVGKVLKLDPSLLNDPNYLKNYPDVASFLAANPVIAHNPHYFLDDISGFQEVAPRTSAQRMWEQMMEGLSIFGILSLIAFALGWLIRTVIEHRRWSRLARVQAEVHTKLLDRFSSNEEVLAYIQTPAGRRFMESAPIQVEAAPQKIGAPLSRILWSLQAGLVLGAGGLGLEIVSKSVEKEVSQPTFALGVIVLAVGIGFVLSAAVSFLISRRLGLFDPSPETTA